MRGIVKCNINAKEEDNKRRKKTKKKADTLSLDFLACVICGFGVPSLTASFDEAERHYSCEFVVFTSVAMTIVFCGVTPSGLIAHIPRLRRYLLL
jgi:hypothetical protein